VQHKTISDLLQIIIKQTKPELPTLLHSSSSLLGGKCLCVALANKKLSIDGEVDLGIIEKLAKKKLKRKPQVTA
jgi:hypothetical protein